MLFIIAVIVTVLVLITCWFLYSISAGYDKPVFNKSYYDEFSAKSIYKRREAILRYFTSESMCAACKNMENPVKTIYTLEQIPGKMSYEPIWFLAARREHIGQLKLFLTELQFITSVLKSKDDRAVFIYSGSAPSNKLPFFEKLFPNISWILIDPNEHVLMYPGSKTQYDKPFCDFTSYAKTGRGSGIVRPYYDFENPVDKSEFNNNVFETHASDAQIQEIFELFVAKALKYFIIEDFMSNDLANLLKILIGKFSDAIIPVYYLSDIRTNSEGESPSDLDIIWNSAQQATWCRIMRAKKVMLKFRTPFWNTQSSVKRDAEKPMYKSVLYHAKEYCDFIDDYSKNRFRYFKAEQINLQAFAGKTSTETRLITGNYDDFVEYDYRDFEDRLFYFNRIYCDLLIHEEHKNCWNKEIGIDGCGDCAIMCGIFQAYFSKYALPENVLESIKALMKQIKRGFKEKNTYHGIFYESYKNLEQVRNRQFQLDNLIFYRGLKSIKPVKLTFDMQKNRTMVFKKLSELLRSQLSDSDLRRAQIIVVLITDLMSCFGESLFMETACSTIMREFETHKNVKEMMQVIKSTNRKSTGSLSEKEWKAPVLESMKYKNVLYDIKKLKNFIHTRNIKNVYEIVAYSDFSFFRTTDIPHKLGVHYPDLDTSSDFNFLTPPEYPDDVLIVMKCPYINEIFIYHVLQNMQKQLKNNYKNISILLHIDENICIFDYVYGFTKHENIIAPVFSKNAIESEPLTFYSYNISDSELLNLLAVITTK